MEVTKLMRLPDLPELPAAPPERVGWPWTEQSSTLPDQMADGRQWPRISVVTPSYNQGEFLEEAIRSVLLQGYPNLDYIVIDGGSNDDSVRCIRRYEQWISYWVSERDGGQSHAINKGFQSATGKIMGWLNSDDLLLPGSLGLVAGAFASTDCEVLSGDAVVVDAGGRCLGRYRAEHSDIGRMLRETRTFAPQPGTFWTQACWRECGPLAEDLHYVMDYLFFLRVAAARLKWITVDKDLAGFRRHEGQKTWSLDRNHVERPKALHRFAESKFFRHEYAEDVRRALWWEGWLQYWNGLYHVSGTHGSAYTHWLMAPFHNWRCLLLPGFYGKALAPFARRFRRLRELLGRGLHSRAGRTAEQGDQEVP